jgi:hypothetical protein
MPKQNIARLYQVMDKRDNFIKYLIEIPGKDKNTIRRSSSDLDSLIWRLALQGFNFVIDGHSQKYLESSNYGRAYRYKKVPIKKGLRRLIGLQEKALYILFNGG